MKVFIDTGAFIALFIPQERYHKQVSDRYFEYRKQRASFYTSHYILDELFTRMIYDFGKNATEKVLTLLNKSIEKEEIRVLDIDEDTFKKSIETLLKFSEHKISFTDASTFVLIRSFELNEIFTLDSDFKKIGVQTSF